MEKKKKKQKKKIELDNNKRFIKSFDEKKFDATIIEILPEDEIPENKYLYPDLNYKSGFDEYIQNPRILIYTAGYPDVEIFKDEKHFSGGEIVGIKYNDNDDKDNNFLHSCSTKEGSSGSPLININQQVIGIHYGCNNKKTINYGLFIGAIINYLCEECKKNKFIFKSTIINCVVKKEIKKDYKNGEKNDISNTNSKGKKKNNENKEVFINNTGNNIFDKNNINNINIKNKESKKGS